MARLSVTSRDRGGVRALAWIALAAFVAGGTTSACTDETGLRVVIGSDIDDLGSFEVAVWAGEVRREETLRSRRVFVIGEPDGVTLPASMGLVPREGDGLRRVRIEVTGYTPRGTVTRAVTTGFVEGETREVRIDLLGSCEGARCDQGLTCGVEGCEPEARPASLLPRVGARQRPRPDAMTPPDLGERDMGAPLDMAQSPDFSVDPDLGPHMGACPDGFTSIGESCYRVAGDSASWEDAERACVALGAHLVTLDGEDSSVLGSLDPRAPWWTGLGPDSLVTSPAFPLADVDRTVGLCAGEMPAALVGEGVVLVDPSGATDDLIGDGAASCLPELPAMGVPDVGFTLTLGARSLLVLRGRAPTPADGAAIVFPLEGPCRSPYAVDQCFVVTFGDASAAFVRGPGDVGILLELIGVEVELRVVGLRWTSGAEVVASAVPSDLDLEGVDFEDLPCMTLARDGRWRLEDCSRSHTVICERPRASG